MTEIKVLVQRNIKIFLRDKAAVFISFLSIIILLTLYLLFLKNSYVNEYFVEQIGQKEMDFIVNSMIISGVLVINTLNLALGNLGSVVNDFHYNTLSGFLITPVKRFKIISAYYISSFLITVLFSLVMWFIAVIIIGLQTSLWYSFTQIITVSLLLILFSLISTSFMILLVTFMKSINAFGVISGVFGTIIGFVSGIYFPLYILPKAIQHVSSLLPFTHMTIYLKRVLLDTKFKDLTAILGEEAINSYKEAVGFDYMKIFSLDLSPVIILLISTLIGLGLLFWATQRLSQRIKK